jgi:hypothetical protein
MNSQDNPVAPGPLELLDSARTKYRLAMTRARHGPPELALLSLHGSIEDALRAHGMRLGLEAALEPFPQLLEALITAPHAPLSLVEAEGVRRMHRLRARVAHGEQITVADTTIAAYHQLVARLLPRYGVMVVAPEAPAYGEAPPREPATATTTRVRRGETPALPEAQPRGETGRHSRDLAPRRERSVYPDDQPARYVARGSMPSAATRDLPLAREMMREQQARRRGNYGDRVEQMADFWARSQNWLLPVIIVVSMLLIGTVISLSLQQMQAPSTLPTASIGGATGSPATSGEGAGVPAVGPGDAVTTPPMEPTAATEAAPEPPATGLTIGRTAYVRPEAQALNLRGRPSLADDSQIQVTLGPGTAVEVISGPVMADGYEWWQVRAGGVEGWCAGEYLEVR